MQESNIRQQIEAALIHQGHVRYSLCCTLGCCIYMQAVFYVPPAAEEAQVNRLKLLQSNWNHTSFSLRAYRQVKCAAMQLWQCWDLGDLKDNVS